MSQKPISANLLHCSLLWVIYMVKMTVKCEGSESRYTDNDIRLCQLGKELRMPKQQEGGFFGQGCSLLWYEAVLWGLL